VSIRKESYNIFRETDFVIDAIHAPPETSHEQETYPTVEAISEQRRSQPKPQSSSRANDTLSTSVAAAPDAETTAPGSPDALEEEASQQGAFNEETGEINWECPCLGGMAYGPCGDQFRSAFSCFVYSKDEPKGVDCIENFKAMQNCFREHPDIYGAELDDDEGSAEAGDEQGAIEARQPADGRPPPEGSDDGAAIEARKPADDGAPRSAESHSGQGPNTSRQQAVGSTPSP